MFNLKLKSKNKLIVLLLLIFIGIASFVFIAGAWLKYDREIKNHLQFDNGILADVTYLSENQGFIGGTTLNFYVSNYSGNSFDKPQLMSSENFKSIVPNDYLIIENASITPNSSTVPYYLRAKWVITYNNQEIDESLWGFYNIETLPSLNSTYWKEGKDGYYYNTIKDQELSSYNSLHLNEKDTGSILFFEETEQSRYIKFSNEYKYNWDFIYYFDTNKLGISLLVETIQSTEEYVKLNWSPFSDKNLVNDISQFEYRIDNDNNIIIDKYIGKLTDITIDSNMYLTAQQILDGKNNYNNTNNTLVGNELGAIYTIKNIQGLNNKLKNIELPSTITTVNPDLLNGYNHLESIKVNSSLTINLPNLSREDYTFNGWYEINDKGEELTTENLFTSNILSSDKIYISNMIKDNELLEDDIKDYIYRVNTETNEIEIVMYRGDKTEYKIPSKMYLTADQINFGYISYAQRQSYDKNTITFTNTSENATLNVVYVEKVKGDTVYLELGSNIESLNPSIFNKAYYLKTLKINNSFSFDLPSFKHNNKTLFWYYFEDKQDNFAIDINKIVENTNEYGIGYYYTAWLEGLDNPTTTLSDYSYTIDENDNLCITSYNGYKKSIIVPDSFTLSSVDYYNGRKAYSPDTEFNESLMIGKILNVSKVLGLNNSLEEVVLPNTITEISKNVFSESKIKKITIPSTVNTIKSQAFANCYDLTNIYCNTNGTITEGLENINLTTIEENAFYRCTSLNQINLPTTLTKISNFSFYDCRNMVINVPENNIINYIGDFAFALTKIQKINFSSNLAYLGQNSFSSCKELIKVLNLDTAVITKINKGSFDSCTKLSEISLPESVTIIDEKAFSNCSSLKRINIPSSVTDIYTEAFSDCTSLRALYNFKDCKILKIPEKLFYNCTSLKYIEYPASVTKLESLCFGNCSSLETFEITENVNTIYNDALDGCTNITTLACLSKNIYKDSLLGFGYKGNTEVPYNYSLYIDETEITAVPNNFNYTLEEGKYYITKYTGTDTSVVIPSYMNVDGVISKIYGIKLVNNESFFETISGFSNVTNLKISEGIEYIADNVFSDSVSNSNLKQIVLPDSLKTLGANNFNNVTYSEYIIIGAYIESVGDNCFKNNKYTIFIDVVSNFNNTINLLEVRNTSWNKYIYFEKTPLTNFNINEYGLYYYDCANIELWDYDESALIVNNYIGELTEISIPEKLLNIDTLKLYEFSTFNLNINNLTLKVFGDNYIKDINLNITGGLANKLIVYSGISTEDKFYNACIKEVEIYSNNIGTLCVEKTEKITLYGDSYFKFASKPLMLKELILNSNISTPLSFYLPFFNGSIYKDLGDSEEAYDKLVFPVNNEYLYEINESGVYSIKDALICTETTKSSTSDGLTTEEYEKNKEVYDVVNTMKSYEDIEKFSILIDSKNNSVYVYYLKYYDSVSTYVLPTISNYLVEAYNLKINAENKNVIIPSGYIIDKLNFVDENNNYVVANSLNVCNNVQISYNYSLSDIKVKNLTVDNNVFDINLEELETLTIKGDYVVSFISTENTIKLKSIILESDITAIPTDNNKLLQFSFGYYDGYVYKDNEIYHHSNEICLINKAGSYLFNHFTKETEETNNIEYTKIVNNKDNEVYVNKIVDKNTDNSTIELPVVADKTMILENLEFIKESGNITFVIPNNYVITNIGSFNGFTFEKIVVGENVSFSRSLKIVTNSVLSETTYPNIFKQFDVKEYEISSYVGEIEKTTNLEKITIHNNSAIYFTNKNITENNLGKLKTIIIESILTNPLQLKVHISQKTITKNDIICKSDDNYNYYFGADSILIDSETIELDTGVGTYLIADSVLDTEFNDSNLISSKIYEDVNRKIIYIYSLTYNESVTDITLPTKDGYKFVIDGNISCAFTNVTIPNSYTINGLSFVNRIINLYVENNVIINSYIENLNYCMYYNYSNDTVYVKIALNSEENNTITLPIIKKDDNTSYNMVAYDLNVLADGKNLIIPEGYTVSSINSTYDLNSVVIKENVVVLSGAFDEVRVDKYDISSDIGIINNEYTKELVINGDYIVTLKAKQLYGAAGFEKIVLLSDLTRGADLSFKLGYTIGSVYKDLVEGATNTIDYIYFHADIDESCNINKQGTYTFNYFTFKSEYGGNHYSYGASIDTIEKVFYLTSINLYKNCTLPFMDGYTNCAYKLISYNTSTYAITIPDNYILSGELGGKYQYYDKIIIGNNVQFKDIVYINSNVKTETIYNKYFQNYYIENIETSSDIGYCENRYLTNLTINGDCFVAFENYEKLGVSNSFYNLGYLEDITINLDENMVLSNPLQIKFSILMGVIKKDGVVCDCDENYLYNLKESGTYIIQKDYYKPSLDYLDNNNSEMIKDDINKILFIKSLKYDIIDENVNLELVNIEGYTVKVLGRININASYNYNLTIPSSYVFTSNSYFSNNNKKIEILTIEKGATFYWINYKTTFKDCCCIYVNKNDIAENGLSNTYLLDVSSLPSNKIYNLPVVEETNMIADIVNSKYEISVTEYIIEIPDNYTINRLPFSGIISSLTVGSNVTFKDDVISSWYYNELTVNSDFAVNIQYLNKLTVKGDNTIQLNSANSIYYEIYSLNVVLETNLTTPINVVYTGGNVKMYKLNTETSLFDLVASTMNDNLPEDTSISEAGEYIYSYLVYSSSGYYENYRPNDTQKYFYITSLYLYSDTDLSTKFGEYVPILWNTTLYYGNTNDLVIPSNALVCDDIPYTSSGLGDVIVKDGVRFINKSYSVYSLNNSQNDTIDIFTNKSYASLKIESIKYYNVRYIISKSSDITLPYYTSYTNIANLDLFYMAGKNITIPEGYTIMAINANDYYYEKNPDSLKFEADFSYCDKYGEINNKTVLSNKKRILDLYIGKITFKGTNNNYINYYRNIKDNNLLINDIDNKTSVFDEFILYKFSTTLSNFVVPAGCTIDSFYYVNGLYNNPKKNNIETFTIEENVTINNDTEFNSIYFSNITKLITSSSLKVYLSSSISNLTINKDVSVYITNKNSVSFDTITINTNLSENNIIKIKLSSPYDYKIQKDGVDLTKDSEGYYNLSESGEYKQIKNS